MQSAWVEWLVPRRRSPKEGGIDFLSLLSITSMTSATDTPIVGSLFPIASLIISSTMACSSEFDKKQPLRLPLAKSKKAGSRWSDESGWGVYEGYERWRDFVKVTDEHNLKKVTMTSKFLHSSTRWKVLVCAFLREVKLNCRCGAAILFARRISYCERAERNP